MTQAATTLDPRYPVGRFIAPEKLSEADRRELIAQISALPGRLREALSGLTPAQIETPYRDGGWTVRQVVHHLADSHMNAFIRFKFALAETEPAIKAYDENVWAQLPDIPRADPEISVALLDALHQRWTVMLRAMTAADFGRTLVHSERGKLNLDYMLALYAWHSRHHTGHIASLREREGW